MSLKLLFSIVSLFVSFSINAQTYFQEDFTTATEGQAPTGWTQDYHLGPENELWKFYGSGQRVLPAPLEPPYAIFDSQFYNAYSYPEKVALISPTFSVAGASQLILSFDHQYYHFYNDWSNSSAKVEVYNGSEWTEVWSELEESVGYNPEYPFNIVHESHRTVTEYIDITEAIGNVPVVQVRFLYEGDYSFWWAVDNIAVFQPVSQDLKVVGLTESHEWEKYSTQENITVRIQNTGKQLINFNLQSASIEVNIDSNNGGMTQSFSQILDNGVLSVGQSRDVLITSEANLAFPFDYEVDINLQWEADTHLQNNELSLQRNNPKVTTTLPTPILTFTGFINSGLSHSNLDELFPPWIEAQSEANNVPNHRNGASNWYPRNDFAAIPAHINGDAAAFDFYSSHPLDNERFWLLGPTFEATQHTEVRFDLALLDGTIGNSYPSLMDADDEFVLAVSTDGGLRYEAVKTYNQSSIISHTGETEYISLAAYANQPIRLAFYGAANTNDEEATSFASLFLDNVQIYNRNAIDIGILDVEAVETIGCNGFTDTFPIEVRNFGRETLDFESRPLSVNITLEGATSLQLTTEWTTGSLTPAESRWLTLEVENMPILPEGAYTVQISMDLAQDANPFNDHLQFKKKVIPFQELPLTYLDFTDMKEGFIGQLQNTYPNWRESIGESIPIHDIAGWRIGTFGNKNEHPFGEAIYSEFRAADHPQGQWLLSPKFAVSEGASLTYQMALVRDNTIFEDVIPEGSYVQVLISTDCQASFSPLKTYDHTTSISNTGQLENIDLGEYVGQEVVLAFYVRQGILYGTEEAESTPRLFLDNIFVSDVPLQDVAIVEAIAPHSANRFCTKVPQDLKIVVANQGVVDLENVSVNVDLYQTGTNEYITSANGTFNLPLQANQTDTLILEITVSETSGGHYIRSYTHIENDARAENDTLVKGIFFFQTFLFDFPEDTTACDSIVLEPDVPIGVEYLWTPFSLQRSITVYESGEYTLRVRHEGICPVRDTIDVTIYHEPPTALFDVTDLGEGTFQFSNLSSEGENFVWDFGDGNSSQEINPIHTYAENGNYTVSLQAVNPCGEMNHSLQLTWVGIEATFLEESSLLIFPNPSSGLFELQFAVPLEGDWRIRVRNMQGTLVFEDRELHLTSGANGEGYVLDLERVASGVYLVEVWNEGERWIGKIVKK